MSSLRNCVFKRIKLCTLLQLQPSWFIISIYVFMSCMLVCISIHMQDSKSNNSWKYFYDKSHTSFIIKMSARGVAGIYRRIMIILYETTCTKDSKVLANYKLHSFKIWPPSANFFYGYGFFCVWMFFSHRMDVRLFNHFNFVLDAFQVSGQFIDIAHMPQV